MSLQSVSMDKLLWLAFFAVIIVGVGLCSKLEFGTVATGGGRGVHPISQHDCPASAPLKGTFNRNYIGPGDLQYSRADPQVCFTTDGDAEAAGYRRTRR